MTTHVIELLAGRVRVLTARQIARHFYAHRKGPMDCARRTIRTLSRRGFVTAWSAVTADLALTEPMAVLGEEERFPAPGKLAWRNEERWKTAKPERTICITATKKALDTFGGSSRPPRPLELEHDINVSGVYLALRTQEPSVADTWTAEDEIETNAFDGKRPDAMIDRSGPVVIDLLGRGYSRTKIESLLQHYHQHRLELW